MATELDLDQHLAGLNDAIRRGADAARAAGLGAAVPSCPRWDVRELVAHVGMVHRWARAHLLGQADAVGSGADLKEEGRHAADPVRWWQDGAAAFDAAVRTVDDDVVALVFLRDAPPPRRFWARRQCHEATIHAVDALAAQLGRLPSPTESGIAETIALDGIDELLTGFLTRGKKLATEHPKLLGVRTDDDRQPSWTVALGPSSAMTERHAPGAAPEADEVIVGSAVGLYLALWNRGTEISGDEATLEWWRRVAQIRWS